MEKLTHVNISYYLDKLKPELGSANQKRLKIFKQVLQKENPDGVEYPLHPLLEALYPDKDDTAALSAFRAFRFAVKNAASDVDEKFSIEVDQRIQSPASERKYYCLGVSAHKNLLKEYTQKITADINVNEMVSPLASETSGAVISGEKQTVMFFVSYAHADKVLKASLMQKLQSNMNLSKKYNYVLWADGEILVGETWDEAIKKAMASATFGLSLVSLSFLNSKYITNVELPYFLDDDTQGSVLPVGLSKVDFSLHDLKGLESKQIFRNEERFYDQCRGNKKDAFALELFKKIEAHIDKSIAQVKSKKEKSINEISEEEGSTKTQKVQTEKTTLNIEAISHDLDHVVQPLAAEGSLSETHNASHANAVPAIKRLTDWVKTGDTPFCAILGAYGMGKTTMCKLLSHALSEDETAPSVIYLDLRLVAREKRVPKLEEILSIALESNHKATAENITADSIIHSVQNEGALMIFDGLDEVGTSLTDEENRLFIRELFRVLPPHAMHKESATTHQGKMILACRSEFFRNVVQQNSMLTLESRDGIKKSDYKAFVILPFNDAQVREYISKHIEGADVEKIVAFMHSIHNLEELSRRPFNLQLIVEQIPKLEQLRLEGKEVASVNLYETLVESWLERDAGKHQLDRVDKKHLMGYLAFTLWQSHKKSWHIDDVESWLETELEKKNQKYELKDLELFKEDFRTATFIAREGENNFRFTHTSLQEYFLARHIFDALGRRESAVLDITRPSNETFDFLAELMAQKDQRDALEETLEQIFASYVPGVSENAFELLLHLKERYLKKGFLDTSDITLGSIDLENRHIDLRESLLSLEGIRFHGANLRFSKWYGVSLIEADFKECDLTKAGFYDCTLNASLFEDATLVATRFVRCGLYGADFSLAKSYQIEWQESPLFDEALLPSDTTKHFVHPTDPTLAYDTLKREREDKPFWISGHSGRVTSVAFSPDGATVLSGSDDGTLRLWDARSGKHLQTFRGHSGTVTSVAFSPDGATVLSGSDDGTLRLWDAQSGKHLQTFRGHSNTVTSVAFSPDGATVLSGSDDGTLRLWDAQSGKHLQTFKGHSDIVTSVAFSPDGATVLSGSDDKTLRLWDARSGKHLQTFKGHGNVVRSVAYSPDGKTVLSGSDDKTLHLWDARSGKCLQILKGHSGPVRSVAYSPDGKTLLSGFSGKTLRLWDARSGKCLQILKGHSGPVRSVAYSPDGKTVLSGSDDKTLRLWDAQNGKLLQTFKGHSGWVASVAYSPDGKTLLSGLKDKTVRLWDAQSGKLLQTFKGHSGWVTSVAYSPDGKTVLSGSHDETVRLWDAKSGKCLQTFEGHSDLVTSVAFSPDGKTVLSGSDDETVRLWDAKSGKCLQTFEGHSGWNTSVAYSPDGKTVLSGSDDKTVRLWDAKSGKCLQTFEGHGDTVTSVAYSPDGKTVLSGSKDTTVRLWDAKSGKCLQTFEGHSGWVTSVAYSPDGKTLLSGSGDTTVRLWDAKSGKCLQTLEGHSFAVTSVAYSLDGKTVLSGSRDKTVRLWDARSGKCLMSAMGMQGGYASIDHFRNTIQCEGDDVFDIVGWQQLREDSVPLVLPPQMLLAEA